MKTEHDATQLTLEGGTDTELLYSLNYPLFVLKMAVFVFRCLLCMPQNQGPQC